MTDLAIVALTPAGAALGRRLSAALGRGQVSQGAAGARQALTELFFKGHPLVCVMALGIVVRILGPLTKDKTTDPPVVVLDEAGRFAISVLGGHEGGANALANEVAQALGATAVITTASDALGLPVLDLIGRDRGWKIEDRAPLKVMSAAVVRGEPIGVWQTNGQRDWWRPFGDWPTNFHWLDSMTGDYAGFLVIGDGRVPPSPMPCLVYRPPSLVFGVGCRRGVPVEEIEEHFDRVCAAHGFAPLSLGLVATADIKADEPGLIAFAARHGVPLRAFSVHELGAVADLPSPSARVRDKIGIDGVAEPAALLASGVRALLTPKVKGARVTMAVARREDA